MSCSEKCWAPVECPEHGDRMNPRGRSSALDDHYCCDNYQKPDLNPRHLWHEHDSTR